MARSMLGEYLDAEALYRQDIEQGISRIGGAYVPSFVRAYIKAARILVENTADCRPEMVVPCAYLQRHAIELIIKATTEMARHLHRKTRSLQLTREAGRFVDADPVGPAANHHKLSSLLDDLRAALAAVRFECPKPLADLASSMSKIEDDDETRLRYSEGKPKGKYRSASFPDPVVLPIVEWQSQLDAIEREALDMRMQLHPPYTLWEELALETSLCVEEIYHCSEPWEAEGQDGSP